MTWLWRTSRVRMVYLYLKNRQCITARCSEQHTYGRGCLAK